MKPIYTFDIETDPFQYNRNPHPFCCGLYTGDEWFHTWGKNCIGRMQEILQRLPPGIVFAHNGGKFDYFFCMDWLSSRHRVMIVNGRLVRGQMWRPDGHTTELRDSYAIMPFALKNYEKDEIDYRTFEKEYREKHKKKILKYLKTDCTALHKLCVSFFDMFGDNLTIGGTSMKQLKKLHKFDELTAEQDGHIRKSYYYGGRVQCFESGVRFPSAGNKFLAYDLNQCYPYSMRNFKHPISEPIVRQGGQITDKTFFVTVEGRNYGAFPQRTNDGLRFDLSSGVFSVSIHEFNAAIDTATFEIQSIREVVDFERSGNFDTFVDKYHHLRRASQLSGDKIGALFYKYVCNSAYGKFAQNPESYKDYMITDAFTNLCVQLNDAEWEPCVVNDGAGYIVWQKPSNMDTRYNVATGASITGAARSLLIRALAHAKRPLYCDTDSIVCEGLEGVRIDETELGAWKVEKTGDRFAIGGRKLYALFDGDECVKMASKGAKLTAEQIMQICSGDVIEWKKDAPSFDLKGHTTRFIHREIRQTAKESGELF
jgi:hypothetical protein